MIKHQLKCWLLLVSILLATPCIGADDFIPPEPADYNQVDIYLVTVGRGDAVYTLFGHTILRVIDRQRGYDMNFNWGIFDFNDPAFVVNFYRGHLNYLMEIGDFESLITLYRDYEHRQVIQEKINLTASQKARIFQQLRWNSRTENRRYRYDQFLDNCATKPRDVLDLGLGGKIKNALNVADPELSFRKFIRKSAAISSWVYLGLDISSNSYLDEKISPWEAMFLPSELRKYLRTLPAINDDGSAASAPLLSETKILVDHPEPANSVNPYTILACTTILPVAAFFRIKKKHSSKFLANLTIGFGVFSGLIGTILMVNWICSDYRFLKHGLALLIYAPIDWYFVSAGIAMLKRRELPQYLDAVIQGRLLLILAAVIGGVSGLFKQDIAALLWTQGPFIVLTLIILYRHSHRIYEAKAHG